MKYLSLIILITTLISSCKPSKAKEEDKSKYFEGFVEFDEKYLGDDARALHVLKGTFGARAITYISADGAYSRYFIDSNNIILRRDIYRPDSLKFYQLFEGVDSIYALNVTRPLGKTIFLGITKHSSFKVVGHNVDIIKSRQEENSIGGGVEKIYMEYYNDPFYVINPLIYKNMAVEGMENMFSSSPYLTTGTKFVYEDKTSVTTLANRIVVTPVPSWHFEIPKNKVIIEE